jgi:hypothetical protein
MASVDTVVNQVNNTAVSAAYYEYYPVEQLTPLPPKCFTGIFGDQGVDSVLEWIGLLTLVALALIVFIMTGFVLVTVLYNSFKKCQADVIIHNNRLDKFDAQTGYIHQSVPNSGVDVVVDDSTDGL